jgi:DNA-binding NarL/FixJ family response regulator
MIKLIIADDNVVLRQALCEMLEGRGKFSVIAQAADGEQLLEALKSHQPDLVIMDVTMPRLDGVGTLAMMDEDKKGIPILVLSADESERNVRAVLKAGARGFMPKNSSIDELEFAIEAVLQGKTYLSPSITNSLMAKGGSVGVLEDPLSVLTKREVEIMKHLADGKPNRVIGKLLHISTRTVDTHRSNILKKLNVQTNAELVKLAIASGLTSV